MNGQIDTDTKPANIIENERTNKERFAHILVFALPIIAGNLLQQFYQIASSIIVGRHCGKDSLAAIGVSTPIVSLAVFFIIGIGLGLTVLLAKYFGEKNMTKFRSIAYTARTIGIAFSITFAIIAILLAKPILILLNTPDEIMGYATLYLRIIFVGLPFTFLYNYFSSCFLSIGKPEVSFYSLAISSILNVALAYLFIGKLGIGVLGASLANVIAQLCSVIFCIYYIKGNVPLLVFNEKEGLFNKGHIREITAYSLTSAIQQIIFIVGRIIIQRKVNLLGVSVIAGYTAAANLESLLIAPADGISAALASLIAVEFGRQNIREIKKMGFSGFGVCLTYSVLLAGSLWILSPYLVPLFLKAPTPVMVSTGVSYLRWAIFAYLLISCPEVFQAFFRGTGQVKITIVGTLIQISIRVFVTYQLLFHIGIKAISLGTAAGWFVMAIVLSLLTKKWFDKNKESNAKAVH